MEELKSTVATLVVRLESCEHRIADLESDSKANSKSIQAFEITMNNLSNKLDSTVKIADKLLLKLERLEEEPKKMNGTIKYCIITLIVTTLFNQLVTFLFKF